jgi:hypothetical protein
MDNFLMPAKIAAREVSVQHLSEIWSWIAELSRAQAFLFSLPFVVAAAGALPLVAARFARRRSRSDALR